MLCWFQAYSKVKSLCIYVCVYVYAALCLVAQSCLTLCNPMDCSLPGSSVHGDSPGKNTGIGCHALLQGIFPQGRGTEPTSPTLQWILLPSKPQGKSKNTGMGSLSLFQGIFPTQELNQGLLDCRWILYQLSYQGSPFCQIIFHYTSLQATEHSFLYSVVGLCWLSILCELVCMLTPDS